MDRCGPSLTAMDSSETSLTAMDRFEPPFTAMDRYEPPLTTMDRFGPSSRTHVTAHVTATNRLERNIISFYKLANSGVKGLSFQGKNRRLEIIAALAELSFCFSFNIF